MTAYGISTTESLATIVTTRGTSSDWSETTGRDSKESDFMILSVYSKGRTCLPVCYATLVLYTLGDPFSLSRNYKSCLNRITIRAHEKD